MACILDIMYNQNSHHNKAHLGVGGCPPPIGPRISFSNDFVESTTTTTSSHHGRAPPPAVSSDFEFSVSNYTMMSADELFFKGRLLPFKESSSSQRTTTLRDELQNDDEDGEDDVGFPSRPPKNFNRWKKGLMGLRKSHIGSKKPAEHTTQCTKNSQDSVE